MTMPFRPAWSLTETTERLDRRCTVCLGLIEPDLPRLKQGCICPKQLSAAGKAGPEVVVPPRGNREAYRRTGVKDERVVRVYGPGGEAAGQLVCWFRQYDIERILEAMKS